MFAFLTLSRIVSTNEAKDCWWVIQCSVFWKVSRPFEEWVFAKQAESNNERVLPTALLPPPTSSFRRNQAIFKSWIISARLETRAISFKRNSQLLLNFTKRIEPRLYFIESSSDREFFKNLRFSNLYSRYICSYLNSIIQDVFSNRRIIYLPIFL